MFFAFWRFFQFFHSFSVTAGRARLSPGRHNRNQMARSVWSAWSLLPLSDVWRGSKAGASSTHSIRFARHDRPPVLRPCNLSVFPGKSAQKNNIFGYIVQRARPRSRKYGGALRTDAPYPPLLLRHYGMSAARLDFATRVD